MSEEKIRYKIYNKEMLAVIRAIEEWQSMLIELQNTSFLTVTNHQTLKYFTTKHLLNARQTRWADILADYHFKITYCSNTANIIINALTHK